MKSSIISVAVAFSMLAGTAEAGCITGAVVGAVAGHVAHHHALAGAAVGCVVGHELAVHKRKQRREAQEHAH
jgi:hydroxyethylthiazole kinase-like sugar kinase family protein